MQREGGFLIVTWDGGGNVPPAVGLGARLVDAGRRVRLLGPRTLAAATRAAGLEWVAHEAVEPWPDGVAHEDDWERLMLLLNGRALIDDLLSVARADPFDVLIADCLMGAALASGEYLGIPTAVLVHVLYQPFAEDWGDQIVDVVGPRLSLGLEPVDGSSLKGTLARTQLVLAATPPGFDFPIADLPANTFYVGPIDAPGRTSCETDQRWLGHDGTPQVLISLSTTLEGQQKALPPFLDALGRLPVRGLLTLGGVVATDAIRAPSNVDVLGYVPHDALLPHVAATVCHGGLSTVMASLTHGVPLVCVPQGREQPLNAARVEACGVGLAVAPDAPAPALAEAITTVIEDPRYRLAAGRFASSIAEAGSGAEATALVEELASGDGGIKLHG